MTYKLCLVSLISITFSQAALAQIFSQEDTSGPFFGNEAKGKWLIGLKIGQIDNNAEGITDSDAVGLLLGYEFARPVGIGGTSTIELEYLAGSDTDILGGLASYDAEKLNLFLTYRSPGTVYYKFKIGASYSNIEVDGFLLDNGLPFQPGNDLGQIGAVPFLTDDNEDVSVAGGVGLGVRIHENWNAEIEYVTSAGNNELDLITLTGVYRFE